MSRWLRLLRWGVGLGMLGWALGCTAVGWPAATTAPLPEPSPAALAWVGVTASPEAWQACATAALSIEVQLRAPDDLEQVRLTYRLRGAQDGPWQTQAMTWRGQTDGIALLEASIAPTWTPDQAPAEVQYAVEATTASGAYARWPAAADAYASVPVQPCPEPTDQAEAPPATEVAQPPAPPADTPPPPPPTPIPVTPWASSTPIPVTPWASPTPTTMVVALPSPTPTLLIAADVLHSTGQEDNMREWNFFDLDEGKLYTSVNLKVDFQLAPDDEDPYLGVIRPFNKAGFGWIGEDGPPSKADCNIVMAPIPFTIEWPDYQGVYFCYATADGRIGWLRIDVWVSLPLSDRRLVFTWATFE